MICKTLCYVDTNNVQFLCDEEITKGKVGVKAYGLSIIPPVWTLPFFVISSEMFQAYVANNNFPHIAKEWKSRVFDAIQASKIDVSRNLFLRSNTCTEELVERGMFESFECSLGSLFPTIQSYFDEMISKHHYDVGSLLPLLIQQHSQNFGCGHISNERRVSKEHRDWKGEIEYGENYDLITSGSNVFSISIRKWRKQININVNHLECSSLNNIASALELPCTWATNYLYRGHFEWIFDGRQVYIVQADEEQSYGINPMKQLADSFGNVDSPRFEPKILHALSKNDEISHGFFSKIKNPLIYKKLGFQTAPIYLLENKDELDNLKRGKISNGLIDDLIALTTKPLVIRTDIQTNDKSLKQMLPRTDDIRDLDSAIIWLKNTSKELSDKLDNDFIFIIHNFIPAFSSAFAYAEPGNRNVLLESLWGVPEGLYYYTHDKYVIDTKEQDVSKVLLDQIEIAQKRINAKNNFIFPHSDGRWGCEQVSPGYIWKPAIPQKAWLKEIALNTRKISEHLNEGISVMWFVGVDHKKYNCCVFPWHHEEFTYEHVPKHINRKKSGLEKEYAIHKNADIEYLRKRILEGKHGNIKYLLFLPTENSMVRNKDLIHEIGEISKVLDAVIILEGGVLSHAYYQLIRTGAAVDVRNPFDSTILNIEHDKLVRDRIPEKIERSGEIALTRKISSDELLEQLRIKLVEEALEVLDAPSRDDLIQELADVLEVVDGILLKQKIPMESVNAAKIRKKEKVGGFENGIILEKTALPLYRSIKTIEESSQRKENKQLASWSDKKERDDYNEIVKKIKIPLSLKHWTTKVTAKNLKKNQDLYVTLNGERINGSLYIDVLISETLKQRVLFDD